MIYFIIGTKAQIIKMAPVMVEMNRRGIPYRYYSTGQHKDTMDQIHKDFGIREPDAHLVRGGDVVTVVGIFFWLGRTILKMLRRDRVLFPDDGNGLVLVHGDTLSTLVGAMVGRRNLCQVAHVESGLRSERLFDPFPEEITRRIAFFLADILFCPGEWAVGNVPTRNKTIIDTRANTLADSLKLALISKQQSSEAEVFATEPFGVVSIHRTENIISRVRVSRFVAILERVSSAYPILLVMHKTTRKALQRWGFLERIEKNPRIELTPRLSYFKFISVLNEASFVISDGGSNQEECSYLGKPVLLLRKRTERTEGLGESCIISSYDVKKVKLFVQDFNEYQKSTRIDKFSPSSVIVDYLEQRYESG